MEKNANCMLAMPAVVLERTLRREVRQGGRVVEGGFYSNALSDVTRPTPAITAR